MSPEPASEHTLALHRDALRELPFADREDFADAARGLIAASESLLIADEHGRAVWDMDAYAFVDPDDPSPDTVHPSLWRLAQLNGTHGLFEVVPGVYQVRGYDLSNITFIEGERGTIVVDPLISTECAAAALALYRAHRGERLVTAVLYTHSHVDHFGGVKGVLDATRRAVGAARRGRPLVCDRHALTRPADPIRSPRALAGRPSAASRRGLRACPPALRW